MVILVGPLNKAIVDIIVFDQLTYMRFYHNQTCRANTTGNSVTLEKVITHKQRTVPCKDRKVTKPRCAVVPNFYVVGMGIDGYCRALSNVLTVFR